MRKHQSWGGFRAGLRDGQVKLAGDNERRLETLTLALVQLFNCSTVQLYLDDARVAFLFFSQQALATEGKTGKREHKQQTDRWLWN